ncbi:endonuclease NucS domain-containing protein [Burkholderia sp. IDO3]|uniref:endonuclease NucS domain-containing protein n=1 Tax=Burkholderia sp. IDO3 TaxID=1705310 RepID=UPI0013B416DB|nr:endonuclease NucS domain-containing protein [Burkholderia sp. IDO3]
MTEAELRDYIAENIEILESGLTLLDKEKYIPNDLGTRGFIDLYARDAQGHHVLIELKRSNPASREAIHEVQKYAEGVKRHLGVRDEEIRIIIASTEWAELLVSFSRFVSDSTLTILGLKLEVEDSPFRISSSPISLLPINQGRFIAPWHDVNWYLDESSLRKGLASIERSCKEKGIANYVIAILQPSGPIHSDHQANMWNAIGVATSDGEGPSLPVYEFIAYFAMQLNHDECLRILERDADQLDEVRETIADMDASESLGYLYESVSTVEPTPDQDHYEIGYPAKFSKFLNDLGCNVNSVIRHGVFERNTLLSDESILAELRGEDGSTGQRFKRIVSISNKAHMSAARADINNCLDQNPVWQSHLAREISEIEVEFPDGEMEISIFNPSTALLTLYFAMSRDDGILYLPSYHIIVRNPEAVRMYYGCLEAMGRPQEYREILKKYYEGDISLLLFTMTWGGRESRDADIIEDMGLAYRSFRSDITTGTAQDFYIFRDDRWRSCDQANPLELFEKYVEDNEKFVRLVVRRISERSIGGLWDGTSPNTVLDDIADIARGEESKRYFYGAPDDCDVCGDSLEDEKYMIDGAVAGNGSPWGCMCAACFVFGGGAIGPGKGQLYLRDENGWLLVGGFLQ